MTVIKSGASSDEASVNSGKGLHATLYTAAGAPIATATGAPGPADAGLVVRTAGSVTATITAADTTTASPAIGALNADVTVALTGQQGASFGLSAGTLIGTLAPEISYDGGASWSATFFEAPATGLIEPTLIFTAPNPATSRSLIIPAGASHARVRVSAYTSGTTTALMRATAAAGPVVQLVGSAASAGIVAAAFDKRGVQIEMPLDYGIQLGRIPNAFSGRFIGRNTVAAAAVETPLREGTFVQQTAGAQRSFASSSAADTAAGTGVAVIRLTYYKITGSVVTGPFTEDVALSGVTPVNTVATDIAFVESFRCLTLGTAAVAGAANTGIISMFAAIAGGGGIIAQMLAGARRSFLCQHYIPDGKTCIVAGVLASTTSVVADGSRFLLRSQRLPTIPAPAPADQWVIEGVMANGDNPTIYQTLPTVRTITGPARLDGYVINDTPTSIVCTMEISFTEVDA